MKKIQVFGEKPTVLASCIYETGNQVKIALIWSFYLILFIYLLRPKSRPRFITMGFELLANYLGGDWTNTHKSDELTCTKLSFTFTSADKSEMPRYMACGPKANWDFGQRQSQLADIKNSNKKSAYTEMKPWLYCGHSFCHWFNWELEATLIYAKDSTLTLDVIQTILFSKAIISFKILWIFLLSTSRSIFHNEWQFFFESQYSLNTFQI